MADMDPTVLIWPYLRISDRSHLYANQFWLSNIEINTIQIAWTQLKWWDCLGY